jgi:hypothetical protein
MSGFTIAYLPATPLFYKINGLKQTLPSIAAASTLLSMKNV